MRKKILVTGGAGFIGSHLCARLLSEGHEVICLDNFFTGNKDNIYQLISHPYFELIRHDVVDPFKVEVDEIYHLACPASPVHYQYNPIKTIKTSVMGSINMLGLAKRLKAKILLTSTSEVYGCPLEHPQKETYWGNVNPIGERSCYDEGKRAAETLFMDYHRQNNVNIRIVRLFNTFGPHMAVNDGRVVSNFILQALLGEKISLYGDGSQTRSFCYITDTVDGLVNMMNNEEDFIGPVNIGNPEERTMKDLAETIHFLLKTQPEYEYFPEREDDPARRKPDITLAQEKLNFQPRVPFEVGVMKTIEYFKTILENISN